MSEAAVPRPNPVAVPSGDPPTLRQWVRHHDESWIFVVLYLGMAVGLSVLVSLFWLLVVAGLHFLLELFRQRFYREGWKSVTLHALWEVKLDVGLVLLALTLVLYIEVVLGILGIQSAARAAAVTRAGARVGTRAAAWERNLRTFLLTVDEMVRVGHAVVMLGRKRKGAASPPVSSGDATDSAQAGAPASRGRTPAEQAGAEAASRPPAGQEPDAADPAPTDAPSTTDPDGAPVAATEPASEPGPGPAADPAGAPEATTASTDPATDPGAAASTGQDPAPPVELTPALDTAITAPVPDPSDPDRGPSFATPRGRARPTPRPAAWAGRWKLGDRVGMALVVLGIFLIGVAPWLTPHDVRSAGAALAEELRPFPERGQEVHAPEP